MSKKIVIIIMILFSSYVFSYANESIISFEEKDIPILNDELRQNRDGVRNNTTDIATNTTGVATNVTNVATNATNITTKASIVGYILLKDEKDSGTAGGTFTKDAWRTRDINTEETDTGNNCSIDSNQITLDVGTYECLIHCPAYRVGLHKTRLYNITDATTVLAGASVWSYNSSGSTQNLSAVFGRFTIVAEKVFEIQHYCRSTCASDGFGFATTIAEVKEVYTIAEFRKVA